MLDRRIQRVVIEQNRAENGAFRIQVIREGLFEGRFSRHDGSFYIRFLFACEYFVAQAPPGRKRGFIFWGLTRFPVPSVARL
jgi:hypothetical protein